MAHGEFSLFVEVCENVRQTRSKNAKVAAIAQYLAKLDEDSLQAAVLFLSGAIFPKESGMALNLGFTTIMRALSEIANLEPKEIQGIYLQHGDMGALAERAATKRLQAPLLVQQLLLSDLHEQFTKIAEASGSGAADAKKRILTGLLVSCTPVEAKYVVKIASGEMRVGAVEGIVELAIAKAFARELPQVRQAMLLSGDIAQVAVLAKKGSLSTVTIKPLVPLSFMLADVMFSSQEIAEYYQKEMICESKYDGIRVQLHKLKDKVKMFSRTLDDITGSFPEISSAALAVGNDFILDGEVIAYLNRRPLHFQQLQKRLRRKVVNDELRKGVPVIYTPYDLLYLDGQSLIDEPLSKRKTLLAQLPLVEPLHDFGYKIVSSAQEISDAFEESRNAGHEGLVLKEPESSYYPGKRGRHWAKLKTELDTIDAVIVAAEYGHGKRAGTLSDYTFAVRDNNRLRTVGKAYSGLTDKEIAEMTARLRSIMVKDQGYRVLVRPEIVLEVAFDSIQKSDRHDSGFALRFPRIKYLRPDKTVSDIDTIEKVRTIYENQAHLKSR